VAIITALLLEAVASPASRFRLKSRRQVREPIKHLHMKF